MSKKTNPLLWVALGCGALVLVGIVAVVAVGGFAAFKAKEFVAELEANPAKVAGEMIVRADPNLELVSSDDEAGTFTIRNVAEEKEYEISFEDLAEGRVSWTTDEGEFSIDASQADEGGGVVMSGPEGEATFSAGGGDLENVPEWALVYANATKAEAAFAMISDDNAGGMLSITTGDTMEEAADWYEAQLKDAGYDVTRTATNVGGHKAITLVAADEASGRTQNVSCTAEGGETQVILQYGGKP